MRQTFLHSEAPPPYAPGESPFSIKGEMYRQTQRSIEYYDQKSGGNVRREIERLGLGKFMEQPFLSSGNYDALPLPWVSIAIAVALGRDVVELAKSQGLAGAKVEMKGVYAAFLTNLSRRNFAQLFPKVINHLYNFSPLEAWPLGPSEGEGVRVIRRGMPLALAEWWTCATSPFITHPIETNETLAEGSIDIAWTIEPRGLDRKVAVGDVEGVIRWPAVTSKARATARIPVVKPPSDPRATGAMPVFKPPVPGTKKP
jgi:hypothetical protein